MRHSWWVTCCSAVTELSHQLLLLWDPEIYRQEFEMLRWIFVLWLLSSRSGIAGPRAEMCNRRKSVYCVNRHECSALQYHGVLHHKNLFVLGHMLSKAIALVSETGRNWCTAIKGKAKYWNEVGKKISKYVCWSSSHGMGALQNFFSVEERKKIIK